MLKKMPIWKSRGKLLKIEVNDEKIDMAIARHIRRCESLMADLEKALKYDDYPQKDEDLLLLKRQFQEMLEKVNVLLQDVSTIRLKEIQQKNYVRIQDEQYLIDKFEQLQKLRETLSELIEMLQENLSDSELEQGLLAQIYEKINHMIDCFNKLKSDDNHLRALYEQINV